MVRGRWRRAAGSTSREESEPRAILVKYSAPRPFAFFLAKGRATASQSEPVQREPVQREPVQREPIQREPIQREPLQNEPSDG
jgi:hypothetical protein